MASPSRSGVFQQAADRRVERFTESISFDRRIYQQDIRASIAHARMLSSQQIIPQNEAAEIENTLREIEAEIERGEFPIRTELEDIHMHIEQALIDRLGDVGRKLHTARSRNDQIATDLRLWTRDAIDALDAQVKQLQIAFVGRCDADFEIVLPAYTHLQRAQPVLAAHFWLAYCEKLQRDRQRLADCRRRVNVCSLGTAALAGTSLPIDRDQVSDQLGFDKVARNSLDVSSDRDFVLEMAFVLTMISEHLSGWAEEWILWTTTEFDFLRLPQQFCTGSSIMPQKINPDVLELIRGKTARVIGNLQALLVLMKGLPLAYNRDLQEDKQPLFDSVDTVSSCLDLAAPMVAGATLKVDSIRARLDQGHLDATTLMEQLIKRGLPQRTAHHVVGELVGQALSRGVRLADLTAEEIHEASPELDEGIRDSLGVENAIKSFVSHGSTGPQQVRQQIQAWKERLEL